jgi:hypothetical protein
VKLVYAEQVKYLQKEWMTNTLPSRERWVIVLEQNVADDQKRMVNKVTVFCLSGQLL